MYQIGDVLISDEVLTERFICDLQDCMGACCIEGDAGAPVDLDEVMQLEEVLPEIWDDLSIPARKVINKQGVVYADPEGQLVTSIVNGKDCVFTCYDEKGCCCCAVEKAFREGKTQFYKPISCHLYPIRIKKLGDLEALLWQMKRGEARANQGETKQSEVSTMLCPQQRKKRRKKEKLIRDIGGKGEEN